MDVQTWGIVIGVAISLVLSIGPWMFLIHGKLAGLIARVEDIKADLDKIHNNDLAHIYRRLNELPCDAHSVRLDQLER